MEDRFDRIVELPMRQEEVMYFTDMEEEFASLLIQLGTRKNVAKVLVFLAKTPEATSHAIERGTGLRQPEVSLAMRHLMDQGWIRSRESVSEGVGRPMIMYELAKSIDEIMDYIENEKKVETGSQLALVQKLQEHIRCNYDKLVICLAPFNMLLYSLFLSEDMSLIFTF